MAKKSDKAKKTDIVIDLLERHSEVPSPEELLSRFSKMYSGKPAGVVAAIPVPPVVEPVKPRVVETYQELEETAVFEALPEVPVEEPAETAVFEALPEEPVEVFQAAEVMDVPVEDIPVFEVPAEDYASLEEVAAAGDDEEAVPVEEPVDYDAPGATVSMAAVDEAVLADMGVDIENAPRDSNATIVMGAVDESEVEIESSTDDDDSKKKKKKRRHR